MTNELPDALPGPSMKWVYHLCRLIFGAWWLFSGCMHFFWPQLQPLGDEQPAIDFTLALMASGLFDWIKVAEIVLGLTMLANRLMPLTVLALVPINLVIVYWNFVLDEGLVEWTFGAMTILFNAVLAWPWRRYYWRLFAWNGRPDFSYRPGVQG
ncbi:MAG: hypothetical protein ABIT10_13420 [Alteraurantiacibacter sp.]